MDVLETSSKRQPPGDEPAAICRSAGDAARSSAPASASKRLRVALFNDTGREPHVGCLGVSSGHDRMLARLGMDVTHRFFLGEWSELWRGDRVTSLRYFQQSNLPRRLENVDAVVMNGEGTIHHGAGLHLLTVLAGAQSLGISTFLVNAVFQECRQDLATLRRLDDFTVRDARTAEYLRSLEVPHRVVLDSIFEAAFATEPAHDFRGKIVVTDWLQCRDSDVGAAMRRLRAELGGDAIFYPLFDARREQDWRHAVADFRQARLVVTGRHHGVCLAAMAGVPFVALGSNTWKVEGLLSLFPGNLGLCTGEGNLRAMCEQAMREPEKFEAIRQFVEGQRPLTTFKKLAMVQPRSPRAANVDSVTSATTFSATNGTSGGSACDPQKPLKTPFTPPASSGPNPLSPFASELDLWVEDHLTVCGERPTVVIGPGVSGIIQQFLRRGIDARGVDTAPASGLRAFNGRCTAGTVTEWGFDEVRFGSAMLAGALDDLDEAAIRQLLGRLRARGIAAVQVRVLSTERHPERNRAWWEEQFFAAGFRKHVRRCQALPFEQMDQARPLAFYCERLPDSIETAPGQANDAVLAAADPSRVSSREADLLLAPYELAAPLIRPWDTVLDLACGCGAGTHLLRQTTRGGRFIACNPAEDAIAYATQHFGAGTVEFRPQAPDEALMQLTEGSVDFAMVAPTLTDADALDGLLAAMERVLAPGGRLVLSLGAENLAENKQRLRSCRHAFLAENVWCVPGPDSSNAGSLQRISLDHFAPSAGDAGVVVLMRDPLCVGGAAYRETAFRHVADGPSAEVLNYSEFYEDPWILHSLVHAGMRLNSPEPLARTAHRLLVSVPPQSADAGAALCILLYRALEGTLPDGLAISDVEEHAATYLKIVEPNAHQFRWQLSIAYVLAQLAMQRGDLASARRQFAAVGDMDVFQWGPSLGTKKSEALFLAGWLAWCADDAVQCRQFWTQGVEFGRQLLARPLDETLLNPAFPGLFDYGDGMRETIYALENVAMCANGLHGLQLRERGISFRRDLIRNSFRTQRDQRERHLRQAQERVTDLCRQLEHTRHELVERTEALNRSAQDLIQRTEELDTLRAANELGAAVDSLMTRV